MREQEGVEGECDKHDEQKVIENSGLDKESSPNNGNCDDPVETNEHSETSDSESSEMDSSSEHDYDNHSAFFVEKHIDGKDDEENSEFMDNEDIESVIEESELNSVEHVDEISNAAVSDMETCKVLSLFAIASNSLERCYGGDIQK